MYVQSSAECAVHCSAQIKRRILKCIVENGSIAIVNVHSLNT